MISSLLLLEEWYFLIMHTFMFPIVYWGLGLSLSSVLPAYLVARRELRVVGLHLLCLPPVKGSRIFWKTVPDLATS